MLRKSGLFTVFALSALLVAAPVAFAKGILAGGSYKHDPDVMERCNGAVTQVTDVGMENVRTTAWGFGTPGGGGEGGVFDPKPVLQTRVELKEGCLNAHLSALVGSAQTYGTSPVTLFQVSLSRWDPVSGTWLPPQHMYGHHETPYGIYAPAVALEAETDVDELGANFFQRIGDGKYEVPAGVYLVDVWWAGGPPVGAGSAIGAAFVLKLYQQ